MLQNGFPAIRYADDWLLLVGSEEEADTALGTARGVFSTMNIRMNLDKSGIGDLRNEKVEFLGHRIDSLHVDADPRGWKRFAEALVKFKNANDSSEMLEARSKLSGIKAMYRNAGEIAREENE